jgi:hypothetical protein
MLQLPKLDILIGGKKLSESEMVNMFNKEKKKFTDEIAHDFDGTVANTLILINLRAKQKLPDGSFSEPQNISYFTTPEVFLSCKNLAEYCDQLAILNQWTYYSDFTIAVIPKDARMQAMIGLTAAQQSDKNQYDEIVEEVGEEKAHLYTSKSGAAPQIFIAHVSEYQVYDMGPVSTYDFKKIHVRNVLTNQFTIYLLVLEFLNIRFHNSFKRIHDIVNIFNEKFYYTDPFRKLFHYTDPKQVKVTHVVNNISFLMLEYPNTKAIVPFKEPQKALLVLKPTSINNRVPRVSLRHTYITPLIIRAVKTLK